MGCGVLFVPAGLVPGRDDALRQVSDSELHARSHQPPGKAVGLLRMPGLCRLSSR
jgi:hypothetical protein